MFLIRAALLLVFLAFMPGLFDPFEPVKASAIRVIGLGIMAEMVASRRIVAPGRWRPLDLAMVAWLGTEILCTVFSVAPRVSLMGEAQQPDGLLTSLGLGGLYFLARRLFGQPGAARAALQSVVWVAVLACVYPLAQVVGLDPLPWRNIPTVGSAGAVVLRPFGTLGHANLLGAVTSASLPIACVMALGAPRRWQFGASFVLLGLVTLLTFSRAAWLASLGGMAAAAAIALRGPGGVAIPRRALAWGAVFGLVLVVLMMARGLGGHVVNRIGESLRAGMGGGSSRVLIWRSAIAAWSARPFLGQGPDTFGLVVTRFLTPELWRIEWSPHAYHAHSIYLQTMVTRGVVGILVGGFGTAALGAAWWRARQVEGSSERSLFAATTGMLVALAVAGGFGSLGTAGALLVVLGCASMAHQADEIASLDDRSAPTSPAAGQLARPLTRHAARPRRPAGVPATSSPRSAGPLAARPARRWRSLVVGLVVSALLLGWSWIYLRTCHTAEEARSLMPTDPQSAVGLARRAAEFRPRDDRLTRTLAEALVWHAMALNDGRALPALQEAEAVARAAIKLVPLRAENWFILGRALGAREVLGDTTAAAGAQAAYERALQLYPSEARMMVEYAEHELIMRRAPHAVSLLRRVVQLYPEEGSGWYRLSKALLVMGRRAEARGAVERALALPWLELLDERADAEEMLRTFPR